MNIETGKTARSLGKLGPNPKAKLRDQFHEVARFKYFSERTEDSYWQWVVRYLKFHRQPTPNPSKEGNQQGWRQPREMGAAEVRAYLSHLAVSKDVAAATQRLALNAIVFLYSDVLGMEPGLIGEIERPQRPAKLPTVLTKDEVRRVLAQLEGTQQLIGRLLHGRGLRLQDAGRFGGEEPVGW